MTDTIDATASPPGPASGPASAAPAATGGQCAPPGAGPGYWGKYRGTVIDNVDLLQQGRLMCEVPALPGMLLNWALPCVPYAGFEVGFYAMPPIGANVWIEFEQGDVSYPIWTGCFWETAEIPLALEVSPEDPSLVKVFRSDFCTLLMNDTPGVGGLTLSVIDPAVAVPVTVIMSSEGLAINVGEVNFTMSAELGIVLEVAEVVTSMTPATVATVAPAISMTGAVNVTGATAVEGDVSVLGLFDVEGASSLTPAVTINGVLNVDGGVQMAPVVNVAGALLVEGETNIGGALTCEGAANIAGVLGVEGDANIAGAGQVEGNWAVLGLIEGIVVPPLL